MYVVPSVFSKSEACKKIDCDAEVFDGFMSLTLYPSLTQALPAIIEIESGYKNAFFIKVS